MLKMMMMLVTMTGIINAFLKGGVSGPHMVADSTCARFCLLHGQGQKWGGGPARLEDRPVQVQLLLLAAPAGDQVSN